MTVEQLKRFLLREAAPEGMNPHVWRKFKQAEKNMLRLARGRQTQQGFRKARMWAHTMSRWNRKMDVWFQSPEQGCGEL